jgi:pyruvate kinase
VKHLHVHSGKRTKIVATLGPATNDKETLTEMLKAGLNAVRLNFSHGDHQSHAQLITLARELSQEMNSPIAIIGDLRGPHIRVGDIEDDCVTLTEGQTFTLTPETCLGNGQRVTISYPKLAQDLEEGNTLLLDDGSIQLQVTRLLPDNAVEGIITQGGTLSSRRGVNVPGIHLSLPPLTQKDLVDIDFAISHNIDFLALSFVQSANDIQTLKTTLAAKNSEMAVIAKIERSGALEDIDAIVGRVDGVMVARGDMALEMSFKEIPIAQKRIISICRKKGVPVITATQMLESMINVSKPTRAEATDVANAVFDGTDALMLSGETAIGRYPVQTVATMSRIAERAEQAWVTGEVPKPPEIDPEPTIEGIISYSSSVAAKHLSVAAIITYTRSGGTARRISRFRPAAPILVLTPNSRTYNQLALCWGVNPLLIEELDNTDIMTQMAIDYAQTYDIAHPGDYVAITSGNPAGPPGNTNLLRIEQIGSQNT